MASRTSPVPSRASVPSIEVPSARARIAAAVGRPRALFGAIAAAADPHGAEGDAHARPADASEISQGELVRGYVKAVSARGCFVSLSPSLDGFIGLKHISDEFIKVEALPSLVSEGQLVVARVLTSGSDGRPSP